MRFPEFKKSYYQTTISKLATIVGGGTPDTTVQEYWNGGIQWFTPSEIGKKKYADKSERTISQEGLNNSCAKLLPINTILLSTRATIGESSIAKVECCTNQGFQSLIANEKIVCYEYMYYLVATLKKELIRKSCGSTFLEISANEVRKIKTFVPSLDEQSKVSSLLSLIDDRIATQIKIIEKLESLIRGLITDVNSGRIAQCKSVYLRDLLIEQHEKNTNNYEVCSVSVSQGVINQIDYLGRSFAAKEVLHYNVVNCGDIVYTKSPTGEFPYGIVKRSDITKPVAVSPLYGVYRPINDYVGRYLHLYFKSPINAKNYLHKLIQKGAKNTINITNQHFLDNKILIPEKGWLDKIVKFAAAIEMKIATENKVLQTLQQQKDFLLSKMFI